MPGIVYDAIDAYIHDLSNRGDAALQAVEKQGRDENWPIVGPAEGSLLHVLARAIGARRILELATAIGYSGKRGPSRGAEVIHGYERRLGADSLMAAVIVPLRDGVSIALKVSD